MALTLCDRALTRSIEDSSSEYFVVYSTDKPGERPVAVCKYKSGAEMIKIEKMRWGKEAKIEPITKEGLLKLIEEGIF